MKDFSISHKQQTAIFVLIILIFISFAVASSLTYRPEVDEGMFASPAMNLAAEGYMGTTVLDTSGTNLTRIEQRTYWVMPLFLVNAAAFFKVFGASLFAMWLVSTFWGIILLISFYFITLKLSKNKNTALLSMGLVACSYMVIATASLARMDIMSASLGFAGIAVYLSFREKDFSKAIFFSQTLVMLSGLTHSNGIMAFVGLAFLTLYYDFRRIKIKHIFLAAIPYIIGGIGFGIWVLQDYQAFKDQFIDNAKMGGRLAGFTAPLEGFIKEFTERYPHAVGLGATTGGHSGPIYLKSLILIGYIVGVLGLIFTKELRQNLNYFALLILVGIYFAGLTILDGQKETYYLIHIIPLYVACFAIWLNWAWNNYSNSLMRLGLIGGVFIFIMLQIGGIGLRIKQNTYGRLYKPTIAYLKENSTEKDLIMGKSDLGFELGFPKNFIDDGEFAYSSGKRPKFIIYDSQVESSWQDSKVSFPEFYVYFPKLLKEEYKVAYENEGYKVYVRNQ
ncbi:MAG: hypothetical protein ACR2J3_08750 [Aridibacter sp.]